MSSRHTGGRAGGSRTHSYAVRIEGTPPFTDRFTFALPPWLAALPRPADGLGDGMNRSQNTTDAARQSHTTHVAPVGCGPHHARDALTEKRTQ